MRLRNGDTLDEDWPTDEPYLFNAVVMNPPYSANWSADDKFLSDPRFERYTKLAPKSKAELAVTDETRELIEATKKIFKAVI